MPVRLGKIELLSVQSLHAVESRTLVEQRVPEQQGSVFQDLGREPVTLVLEGLLLGEKALSQLEQLRAAQAKAAPLPFAADIAVGTELTEMVIEDLKAQQVAGYAQRFRFQLRLREYIAPPQPQAKTQARIAQSVKKDAANWGQQRMAASAVMQDPTRLPQALASQPGLVKQLDMNRLGAKVAANMGRLQAQQVGGMLQALAEHDPAKATGLFNALGKAGALNTLLAKAVAEGGGFLEMVKKLQPSTLLKAFGGALEFLQKLKNVAQSASQVAQDVGNLSWPTELQTLLKNSPPKGGT
jgi:hypothetical protein